MTKLQSISLFALRVLIGWHLLYEGVTKLLDPNWSASGYLKASQGIFSGIFKALSENASLLAAVDFLNQWGLTLIGLALILGCYTRVVAYMGMFFLLLYYLCLPPWRGLTYYMPSEGNYLIVNKTLIEAVALWVLAIFPSGRQYGLDLILGKQKNQSHG